MSPRTPSTDRSATTDTRSPDAIDCNGQERVTQQVLSTAILLEAQDAIFSSTLDGIVTTWNHAAERLFGYSTEEILGMPNSLFVPPASLLENEILVDYLCQGNLPAPFDTVRRHKGGEILRVTLTLSPIKNRLGEVIGVSTIARDTTEPQQIIQALKQVGKMPEFPLSERDDSGFHVKTLPTTDSLTGLKNHRVFQEWLRSSVDQAICDAAPLSVLLINVDRFKSYNERFGYQAGDYVLQKIGAVLKETARTTEQAARFGGAEFAVLLLETNVAGSKAIAERFRSAIETVAWPHQPITASFGIATLGLEASGPAALLAQAESALARSKEKGRNSVTHAVDPIAPRQEDSSEAVVLRQLEKIQAHSPESASEALKHSLQASYDTTVESWSRILDLRDKETEGHNRRVTSLMVRLAKHVGMDDDAVLYAKWGAQLHDIGKMAVPDEILHKRGPLTVEEWIEIRRHPAIAYEMLAPIEFLGPAIDIAYCHHEKWDGTGYPRALRGNAIPYAARLFAVIDVYDALCSDRSYRDGWPEHRVCDYLRRQAGSHFDPRAVDAFLEMLELQEDHRESVLPSQYIAFA